MDQSVLSAWKRSKRRVCHGAEGRDRTISFPSFIDGSAGQDRVSVKLPPPADEALAGHQLPGEGQGRWPEIGAVLSSAIIQHLVPVLTPRAHLRIRS
jgi:hypothetical protein